MINNDLHDSIIDPSGDGSLILIIDKTEPVAPWLAISPVNPTTLTGTVPDDATGQHYQINLRANSRSGGSSDLVKIPLQIARDERLSPHFKAANPELPIAYPGQPFIHDFVANRDVLPEYEDLPYIIELAEGYDNPVWLRIEDNQLIADLVPETSESTYQVYLTIKNVPGGKSEVVSSTLFVMN